MATSNFIKVTIIGNAPKDFHNYITLTIMKNLIEKEMLLNDLLKVWKK